MHERFWDVHGVRSGNLQDSHGHCYLHRLSRQYELARGQHLGERLPLQRGLHGARRGALLRVWRGDLQGLPRLGGVWVLCDRHVLLHCSIHCMSGVSVVLELARRQLCRGPMHLLSRVHKQHFLMRIISMMLLGLTVFSY
jgi:hypothetical protein